MGSSIVSKRDLMRSTALTAFFAAPLLFPTPANAVVLSNAQYIDSVSQSAGADCAVRFRYDRTGTQNDVNGLDQYRIGVRNVSTGQIPSGLVFRGIAPGQSETNVTEGLIYTDVVRGDREVVIFEVNGVTTGSEILTIPIPRTDLIAAGQGCANLASNGAPLADAGPDQNQNVAGPSGNSIVVDASNSNDPDGDVISFAWTQTAGPQASILSPSQASTTIDTPTLNGPTTFEFQVVTTDPLGETSSDIVSITLTPPPNSPPVVDAGPDQTVAGGGSVTLVGTASDADNDPLTTQWTQVGGPTVNLSSATSLSPTFTAPGRGINDQLLTFELRADDGTVASSDQIVVIVSGNEAPTVVATAGPVSGGGNTVFTLDGSGTTDPEGDPLIYQWTQTAGPTVAINNPTSAVTTFTAPQGGSGLNQTLSFELRATDTFDEGDTANVSVDLLANGGPLVDAGSDQTVQGGSTVMLDASGSSDPDGDPITYTWTQSGGPAVSLSDPNSATPSFVAPAAIGSPQPIIFDLVVSDGLANSRTDQVTITVAANRPPVVDAGVDQGPIDSGTTVTLDGSGSSDPDGDTLTYTWTQVSGTAVTLSDASAASPTFTAPVVAGNEDLVFELVVSDGQTSSVADRVTVGIRAVGSVTIVQRVIGSDTTVAFTSDIAALNGNVTTSGGAGQIAATGIAVGTYSLTAADLSGQGYALTDIICNDGDSTANLATRSVSLALSPNEDLTCTFTLANTREAASIAINQFLAGRNALILSHQPDLQRRLDRLTGASAKSGSVTAYNLPVPGGSALPLSLSLGDGRAQASTSLSAVASAVGDRKRRTGLFDMWAELYYSRARIGGQEGNFRMAYIGADYRIDDTVLLGALVAFDDFSDRGNLEAGEAEGNGWMAGPYITAKLDEDFYAEARAAWGSSDNRVSPLGTFADSFDTSRSFYSGSLIGQFDLGDKTTFRPEVTLRYISEKQKAYVDSLNITIPSQTVDQGDISFRPRFSHLVEMESGWSMRPYGEVEGIITFGDTSGEVFASLANAGQVLDLGSLRARVEGGVDFMSDTGIRASVAAFHDGIGSDNFRSSGVHVGISFGF